MDYPRICWYCGSPQIIKVDSYYICDECGAIWNKVPDVESSPVEGEKSNAI